MDTATQTPCKVRVRTHIGACICIRSTHHPRPFLRTPARVCVPWNSAVVREPAVLGCTTSLMLCCSHWVWPHANPTPPPHAEARTGVYIKLFFGSLRLRLSGEYATRAQICLNPDSCSCVMSCTAARKLFNWSLLPAPLHLMIRVEMYLPTLTYYSHADLVLLWVLTIIYAYTSYVLCN